jgi:hypothetical protein
MAPTGTAISVGGYYFRTNRTIPAGVAPSILFATGSTDRPRPLAGLTEFLAVRQHVWKWVSVASEWFPGQLSDQGFVTALVRGAFHPEGRIGPFDLSTTQLKLDVGVVTFYGSFRTRSSSVAERGGTEILSLPWLGLGVYWM